MQQIVQHRSVWGAACIVSCVGLLGSAPATAAVNASAGCEAANRGSMNFSVSAAGSAAKQASLEEGEILTLNVSTRGTAVVTVSGSDGVTRTLHNGRASAIVFVAPSSAAYDFRLDAGQTERVALSVSCTSVARSAAERALLDRRKAFLTSREPDRIRIDRPPAEVKPIDPEAQTTRNGEVPREVTASVSLSELAAAMKPGSKPEPGILDFWFEGRHLTYDALDLNARQRDGSYSVMYLGSKYMLGPDIMLGYLAQFDQTDEVSRYGDGASASGWMAGPYMSVRFGPGVVFDGRAAWGVAESLPNGVAIDTTPADRSLLRGTLRGTRQVSGWTVAPSVGLSYVQDTPALQESSFEGASTSPTGTGRLDVLPEMKRRFELNSEAFIEPRIAAGGFVPFDNVSQLGGVSQSPDLRWKAEAGVAVGVKDSMNLQATGGVESGGQSASDTWSGRLQLNMPLGK